MSIPGHVKNKEQIFFFQGLEVREEFFDTKDAENVTLRDGPKV